MAGNCKRRLAKRLVSFFSFTCVLLFAQNALSKTLIFDSNARSASEQANVSQEAEPAGRTISTTTLKPSGNANAMAEMFFMVEQLKQEVSELRGIVEEQSFRLRNFEEGNKRRYQDLDQRLLRLSKPNEASAKNTPVSTGAAIGNAGSVALVPVQESAPQAPTQEQKSAYASAYQYVRDKKFNEAVDALHAYIDKYPEGELTGNAYYWLGEVYLVLPKLEQAKQSFLILLKSYPNHRKLADAIFKLAVTYDRLLDPDNSEKYLKMVRERFPGSTAAKLANNYKISR